MNVWQKLIVVSLTVPLAGCLTPSKGHESSGSIVGGFIGQQTGATGAGLLGGFFGKTLVQNWGKRRNYAMEAFQKTCETRKKGETVSWSNPYNLENGSYTPWKTVMRPDGVYCREISETVTTNNRVYSNFVQACRNDETGKWEVTK